MANYLDINGLKDFLYERGLEHLYNIDDVPYMINQLKDKNIITGTIYEPIYSKDTFQGVNKVSNFRILFKIK